MKIPKSLHGFESLSEDLTSVLHLSAKEVEKKDQNIYKAVAIAAKYSSSVNSIDNAMYIIDAMVQTLLDSQFKYDHWKKELEEEGIEWNSGIKPGVVND